MTPREFPPREASRNIPTASSLPPPSPASAASLKKNHEMTAREPIQTPVSYPNISINVGTTNLNLHPSSDTTASLSPHVLSNPGTRCLIRVKWLQGLETENVDSRATNAEDLSYDTEIVFTHDATRTPTELHLRRGDDCVSIKYTSDGPR